jgi:hypothetical protein
LAGPKSMGMITSHDQVLALQECPTYAHRGYVLAFDFVSEQHGATHPQCNSSFKKAEFPPTVTASWAEEN